MTAETIARGLGLRRQGRTWRGPCPMHGGSSFTLQEKDGKILFYCWSGCDRDAILEELRARGLWPKPDWTPQRKRDFAAGRRRDEADLPKAKAFAAVAAQLAEELLERLPAAGLERLSLTALVSDLRTEAGILATYREWKTRHPKLAAAMVAAQQKRQERLEILLLNYLLREASDAA